MCLTANQFWFVQLNWRWHTKKSNGENVWVCVKQRTKQINEQAPCLSYQVSNKIVGMYSENLIKCQHCKPIYKSRQCSEHETKALSNYMALAHWTGWYFQIPTNFFTSLFCTSIQKSIILQLSIFSLLSCRCAATLESRVSLKAPRERERWREKKSRRKEQMGNGWTNQICMFFPLESTSRWKWARKRKRTKVYAFTRSASNTTKF